MFHKDLTRRDGMVLNDPVQAAEPEAEQGSDEMDLDEPEQEVADQANRRFKLYININSIINEFHLEDMYYEDDTTYRHIIEEIKHILNRIIPGFKDTPSDVQIEVLHARRGIPMIINLHTPTVDNPVQDGDVIYATPLTDNDTIARALRDPNVARSFHKAINQVQYQGQRKYGGKTRNRLRGRNRSRKHKCSKKCNHTYKRLKKRKRTRRRICNF